MSLLVCEKQCDQCLLSPNRVVRKERVADVLKNCRKKDSHFICHKATIAGHEVVCRGFYDSQTSQMIRIAQRLNAIEFVDPTTGKSGSP